MTQKNMMMASVVTLTVLVGTSDAQTSNYNPMLNAQEKQSIDAGDIIMRELDTKQDKGQTIETIGLINAPGDSLVLLLTDYEGYPEFMSAVDDIEVVDTTGAESTINYILKPMLGLIKKYRIKIAPIKLDDKVWKIEWHMVVWPGLTPMETIGDTQGYWLIIEQSENRSLVQYYVYSDPSPVPFGLGGIVDALGRASIEDVFNETRTEAVRMMGSQE
ncbi:MAG: hypothetical protein HN995_07210 [Candidatus Marinimicrobia bacterium]|jgi:hypothetical protein|nr:hypothetical protein [Candidatus Neomarinimicrobiota bacterium]MBT3681015.1 hypothetical protein [Candidatus Neomarinimicrobiota bacterium]MBT3952148.1 hypothetical protein [Candidatus Neomarinimicrobiota bacterium]MBT4254346.1 hypothetical protein [Candidatus Neomarinimicrobiota bacterium]MBT4479527.1 hypothetical protein [Candidatus Neomarinimicrobiota bacterium]